MKKKTNKIRNLKQLVSKKRVFAICLIIFVTVVMFHFRDMILCPYPVIVMQYKMRYNQMKDATYIGELKDYCRNELNDSIDGLNYVELLFWEYKHLKYPNTDSYRPELPIDILKEGEGNCGEFALLYNGLLLANGYRSRIVVDMSVKTDNRVAGDHVWIEICFTVYEYDSANKDVIVKTNLWFHIDPTEGIMNSPDMYSNPDKWNKNVNLVYTIEGDTITDVTETYRWKQ